jgi:phosphoglycolate phosphatase
VSSGPVVLLWDIDGTLLSTDRAGIAAWEAAALEATGSHIDLTSLPTAGLTDGQIAVAILSRTLPNSDDSDVGRLLASYEAHLPEALGRRQGGVLDGVAEILAALPPPPRCLPLLLTGNTARGAEAKLAHYGLTDAFPYGGAFCEGAEERASIAHRAAALASTTLAVEISPDRLFVIGDTPHDVHCGKAIGAKTIAVASGDYSREHLERLSPWVTLARLPDPAAFGLLVGCHATAKPEAG